MASKDKLVLNSVRFLKNPWKATNTQFYTPQKRVFKFKTNAVANRNFCRLHLLFPTVTVADICYILEINGGNFTKALDSLLFSKFIDKGLPKTKRQTQGAARCLPVFLDVPQENDFSGLIEPSCKLKRYRLDAPHSMLPNVRYAAQQSNLDFFYDIESVAEITHNTSTNNADVQEIESSSDEIDVEENLVNEHSSIKIKLIKSGNNYTTKIML